MPILDKTIDCIKSSVTPKIVEWVMVPSTKSSILQSLIEKPDGERPDWRLWCDLLRLDLGISGAELRLAALLRSLTRYMAAGIWDKRKPGALIALSGSNIKDKVLPRYSCFAYALALQEFSSIPVSAEDLPGTWRASAWPQPWLVTHPSGECLLLFTLYGNTPAEAHAAQLELLLAAVAEILGRRPESAAQVSQLSSSVNPTRSVT